MLCAAPVPATNPSPTVVARLGASGITAVKAYAAHQHFTASLHAVLATKFGVPAVSGALAEITASRAPVAKLPTGVPALASLPDSPGAIQASPVAPAPQSAQPVSPSLANFLSVLPTTPGAAAKAKDLPGTHPAPASQGAVAAQSNIVPASPQDSSLNVQIENPPAAVANSDQLGEWAPKKSVPDAPSPAGLAAAGAALPLRATAASALAHTPPESAPPPDAAAQSIGAAKPAKSAVPIQAGAAPGTAASGVAQAPSTGTTATALARAEPDQQHPALAGPQTRAQEGSAPPLPRPQTAGPVAAPATAPAKAAQPQDAPQPNASAAGQLQHLAATQVPPPPIDQSGQASTASAAAAGAAATVPSGGATQLVVVPLPAAASTPAPAVTAQPVAIHIAPGANGQLTIQLHPASLGGVQVQIDHTPSGTANVVIQVEKPETLHVLQQDLSSLHQALDRAGIASDQRLLTLHLAAQSTASTVAAAPSSHDAGTGTSSGQGFGQGFGQGSGLGAEGQRQNSTPRQSATQIVLAANADPHEPSPQIWLQAGLNITA